MTTTAEQMASLIEWAVAEIRELDATCRAMIPAYAPLDSDDMQRLAALKAIASSVRVREKKDG